VFDLGREFRTNPAKSVTARPGLLSAFENSEGQMVPERLQIKHVPYCAIRLNKPN
jgi:hypothetical protein